MSPTSFLLLFILSDIAMFLFSFRCVLILLH
nr:MAG TPA: IBV 3A protein [Caudoviricetes sp.]